MPSVSYLGIEEVQALLLDMLDKLDAIFREQGIRYSLDGGTLLGAIRHKGFIPWDDDADIIVPRPDVDRIIAHPEWAPEGYGFEVPGTPGYPFPFVKFVNYAWRAQEPMFEGVYGEHLWIDIFPADPVPDDAHEAERFLARQQALCMRGVRSSVNPRADWGGPARRLAKSLLLPVHRLLFPAEKQYRLLEEGARSNPYGSTDRVAIVIWDVEHCRHGFPTSDFDELVGADFEGRSFRVCPHWHEHLVGLYGDYMAMPPEEERTTHGIKVWRDSWNA